MSCTHESCSLFIDIRQNNDFSNVQCDFKKLYNTCDIDCTYQKRVCPIWNVDIFFEHLKTIGI